MIIETNIKSKIQRELIDAKSVWIATAMISNNGWEFIQKNISTDAEQHFLIGIDLATDPKVFEALLDNLKINARVYQTNFTFHPKVYLFRKTDNSYIAFIGSSNTTNWGLEKNVEMNFFVVDQKECKKLLKWFNNLYKDGYIITEDFVKNYKSKFVQASFRKQATISDVKKISHELSKDKDQFFSRNHHQIFEKKYHLVNTSDLKRIRKEVSNKFKELNKSVYPRFTNFGLSDLHCHYNTREIVSRHFFNQYSGNYVNAMWLHYGKSKKELSKYDSVDLSINKPSSFINNIRIQVIIHEKSIGVWLVLGRNGGSFQDRESFKNLLNDGNKLSVFYNEIENIKDEYWIDNGIKPINVKDIKGAEELKKIVQQSNIKNYFIIGREIDFLDDLLSNTNISNTILLEFQKLYPLYELMKDK